MVKVALPVTVMVVSPTLTPFQNAVKEQMPVSRFKSTMPSDPLVPL